MAFKVGTGYVDVKGDFSSLDKQLSRRGDFARKLGKAGLAGGAALAVGVAAGARKAVGDASDLNESINKATATFEKSAPKIRRWADDTADSLGISNQAALENASSIGAMLKPMGIAAPRAAEMSRRMVQLAADMASFNNEDPTEMLDRIRAGLSGESEPLKRFGTVLSETRVQQHAWKVGIAESGEQLTEQQKIMGRYSLLLKDTKDQHGDFARTADGLANVQRRLKANIDDTSASIGQALLPVVKDATGDLNDLAKQVSDVFERRDLSIGEKLSRSLDLTKHELAPYGHEIAQLVEKGVTEGIPAAAEAAAERAPKVAAAFVEGFAKSDEWGRLAIGTFLLAKFGGFGAARKLGVGLGAATAAGAATGAAGGAGAGAAAKGGIVSGLLSNLKGAAGRTSLIAAGLLIGDKVMDEVAHRARERSGDIFEALEEKAKSRGFLKDTLDKVKFGPIDDFHVTGRSGAGQLAADLKDIVTLSQHISPTHARALREEMAKLGDFSKDARKQFNQIIDDGVARAQKLRIIQGNFRSLRNGTVNDLEDMRKLTAKNFADIEKKIGLHTAQGRDAVRDNFTSAIHWISESMRDGKGLTNRGGREIERLLDSHSKAGKKALARNFDDVVDVIRATMQRGGKITDRGLKIIRQLYVEQLKLYGFTPKQAIQEARPNVSFTGGREEGTTGPHAVDERKQRGGPIQNWSQPTGDTVPAWLEHGEYVLNKKAVRKYGKDKLDALNFGIAPRFQSGGIVELLSPFNDPAGHGAPNQHLHIAASTKAEIIRIGKWLQSLGWLVGENPAFGGIQGSHAAGGYHPLGLAIDVNWPSGDPNGEPELSKIRALLPLLKSGEIGAAVEQLKGVQIVGADSPLRTVIQGAVDQARAAAQSRLDSLFPQVEGAEGLGGSAAANRRLGQQMAAAYGWGSGAQWAALDHLWGVDESGWREDVANYQGSGAYGIAQALPASKYPPAGQPGAPNGLAKAQAQIGWGLNYIEDRYGTPIAADAFRHAQGWYRKGGLIELQGGGGAFAAAADKTAGFDFSYYPKRIEGPLGRALEAARGVRPKKARRKIDRLLRMVRSLGLPPKLAQTIADLDLKERTFGEFADRAGRLTDEGKIVDALDKEQAKRIAAGQPFTDADQQAIVEKMLGRVYGGSQIDWLQKQLETLFKLRNRLVEAEPIVVKKRDRIGDLLEKGENRLGLLRRRIKRDTDRRDGLTAYIERTEHDLEAERAKPAGKRNDKWIKFAEQALTQARQEREDLNVKRLRPDIRERAALTDRILPGFRSRIGDLSTLRGELLTQLEEVQGLGGPSGVLKNLPALGILGGNLGDAQFGLAELKGAPPRVSDPEAGRTDVGTPDTDAADAANTDSERAALLEEMLRDARLQLAVSQAQYDVLRMPPYGGSFADGGVVPGPVGAPRTIIAHGGEEILPPGEGNEPHVSVNFADGMGWLRQFVSVEVSRGVGAEVRRGVRALPGKAGFNG